MDWIWILYFISFHRFVLRSQFVVANSVRREYIVNMNNLLAHYFISYFNSVLATKLFRTHFEDRLRSLLLSIYIFSTLFLRTSHQWTYLCRISCCALASSRPLPRLSSSSLWRLSAYDTDTDNVTVSYIVRYSSEPCTGKSFGLIYHRTMHHYTRSLSQHM